MRWFYKAVDDKVWCEFNGYDSLLIENKYREYKIKADNNGSNYIDMVNIDKVVTKDGTNFQHTQVQLDVKDELNKKDLNFLNRKISESDKSSSEFLKMNMNKIDIDNLDDSKTTDNINTIVVRGGNNRSYFRLIIPIDFLTIIVNFLRYV